MEALCCPKCGNGTDQKGITLAYLEWRLISVVGVKDNNIVLDYETNEGADFNEEVWCKNTPNVNPDLEHFHCNACSWNWVDSRPHKDKDD